MGIDLQSSITFNRSETFFSKDSKQHGIHLSLAAIWLIVSEIFTSFYTGGAHGTSAKYLYFGHDGKRALVPWIWTSAAFMVISAILLMRPRVHEHLRTLTVACVLVFIAIWIEKGMGLIIPGFIPSTLHEWVEYIPSATEWKVTAGIWAGGILIYTLLLKVAIPVFSGEASGKGNLG